ncbi:hypothetical protein [Methylocystis sp. JR02]|uniref:hypothetical protein n=1 Tax=Methylocystis sp. JR02 TaxID=3046284 RepID=UPI0024BB950A|nr:hypothetical protein [Methylocystis sp. JR02]MDJ0448658.1 hypothetical protein [Methylocystis sp. JR02]
MTKVLDSNWSQLGVSAVTTGTVAALVSAAALAALAKAEGKGALQPLNATSHWVQGDAAAKVEAPTARNTLVGFATHHLSSVLWAGFFEAWLARNPPRSMWELLRDAFGMSGIAAAVDYGATPHRFTPGWELALSKKSMVGSYIAFAFGLAAGALVSARAREAGQAAWSETTPLLRG